MLDNARDVTGVLTDNLTHNDILKGKSMNKDLYYAVLLCLINALGKLSIEQCKPPTLAFQREPIKRLHGLPLSLSPLLEP